MYIFVKKRQECTHQICYNERKKGKEGFYDFL